jgi:hypothetical protein
VGFEKDPKNEQLFTKFLKAIFKSTQSHMLKATFLADLLIILLTTADLLQT